jgi:hypothetical protein
MKPSNIANKLPLVLSWLVALIIVLLPFHAFLTVWLASLIDQYTLLRLWKEVLLLIVFAGAAYLLVKDKQLRKKFSSSLLTRLIALYLLMSVLWGVVSYGLDKVTLKALGFGLTVNLRFLILFLAIWIIATKSQWLSKIWPKLILIPAAIVVLIGLLQRLVLPYDVLKHFGYSESTIFPYQSINRDINYPRIMSTLRGANPLGAYLVLMLSTIGVFFLKYRKNRWLLGIFGSVTLLVLFFSHSRGAWIGLALSAIFLAWISLKTARARQQVLVGVLGAVAIGLITVVAFWNNPTFQNYFFHTSERSTIEESSNEEHLSAKISGLKEVVTEPLGRGVGSAGPASVYNEGKGRITDNYFIQIGQEVGWLGLAIFLLVNFLVLRELWIRRADNLALILLVSLVGLTAVNLVSHAWTDDTLAYIWWGLAGIALAPAILTDRKHKKNDKNHKKTS